MTKANINAYPLVLTLAQRHIESAHEALAAITDTATERGCSSLLERATTYLADATFLVSALQAQ